MTPAVDPYACAALFIIAFVMAGFAQTAWFASPQSRRFAHPLDGGLRIRGRRLFGEHKTVRGLVVMIPAVAVTLPLAAVLLNGATSSRSSIWPLTLGGYAALGAWCAIGFMAGELPNSFVKRQLDIAPGAAATGAGRLWQLAADRLDSGLGMLVAASLVLDVPWQTWALVLGVGPVFHLSFSFLMFRLGLKPRPA